MASSLHREWKLRVQPVPKNNWGDNLAHLLPEEIWDHLRKEVYKESGYLCEICRKDNVTFHCHENWVYNDRRKTQTLETLMCLCPNCHDCIHCYRSEGQVIRGGGKLQGYPNSYLNTLKAHFCKVNSCSYKTFDYYLGRMLRVRGVRTRNEYELIYGPYSPPRIEQAYYQRVRK